MSPRFRRFRQLLVLAMLFALADPADAGWLGFRNDTGSTLVIQETGAAGRPGKPRKVFANETVRDAVSAGPQRMFAIFDPARPDRPLYTGRFPTPADNENVLYVMKSDGKGGLLIEAVKSRAGVGRSQRPKR
jgi:hypothetical protein